MASRVSRRPGPLGVALAALAAVFLVLLAGAWPVVDAWGWIVWGRELAHLELDTTLGPAWKPLPPLVIAPLSAFGGAAPSLWVAVAAFGAMLGPVAAFALGRRLGGPVAGVIAGLGVALLPGWLGLAAGGYADPLALTGLLGAVERHLAGHRRTALAALLAAALVRPEAWVLLAGYGAWLAVRRGEARVWVALALLSVPALWFGGDLVGSGDALHGSRTAQAADVASPGAAELLRRAASLLTIPTALAFGVGLVQAVRARAPVTLALAGLGVLVVVQVLAMALLGFGGETRFLLPAGGAFAVVAGVGAAYFVSLVRRRPGAPPVLGAAAVAAVVLCLPPLQDAREDLRRVAQGRSSGRALAALVRDAGRRELLACDRVAALGVDLAQLAYRLEVPMSRIAPLDTLRGLDRGAVVVPEDAPAARRALARLGLAGAVRHRHGPWAVVPVRCPALSAPGSARAPRADPRRRPRRARG